MPAATGTEWALAALLGVSAYAPIVIAVRFADRDLPHVSLDPARAVAHRAQDVAEQAAQRARLQLLAWLMVLACHLAQPQEGAR